jgi:hypothetical protein
MAGGQEHHFTDSRELYVLVEGDELAHVELCVPKFDRCDQGPPRWLVVQWAAVGAGA